ncbi:MAG: chemotaxis protein CheD [Hydrogenoanaerobacterium sp.]
MSKTVTVGIADLNVVKTPDILVTYALGSCVGICLYDSMAKVGGLSHIMLPDSTQLTNVTNQPYKFADTAIVQLVRQMERLGARQVLMKAKIAGGAQMFAAMSTSAIANIGQRNVIAVKAALRQLSIPIIAEDTGLDYGRTLYFDAADGVMRIKSANKAERIF